MDQRESTEQLKNVTTGRGDEVETYQEVGQMERNGWIQGILETKSKEPAWWYHFLRWEEQRVKCWGRNQELQFGY